MAPFRVDSPHPSLPRKTGSCTGPLPMPRVGIRASRRRHDGGPRTRPGLLPYCERLKKHPQDSRAVRVEDEARL